MTAASSANPAKLAQFAYDGTVLGNALLGKARALRTAADDLVAAGESVPGLGTFVHDLEDLAYDWLHLDGFARAVAEGFRAQLPGIGGGFPRFDMVIDVGDATLAATAELGYADRDEAIRAAAEIARRLERLAEDDDASAADIAAILVGTHRGRYDPAFAVTLSEALGVDGYVDVVGTIREVHRAESGSDGIDDALADVAVLGTILTTALARTDPCADDDDPDDLALDQAFVDDLTRGYDPGNLTSSYEHTDLSVLVRFTDPPTDVAVAIANHRVAPGLESGLYAELDEQVDLAWGDAHSGILTNHTEMLARNSDASAGWLDDDPPGVGGGTNLDLVLRQNGRRYVDDGAALARVVENGVTHDDLNTRRDLMRQVVEIVGADGDVLANRHMPEALARGVAADMAFIDKHVNTGWSDVKLGAPAPENALSTHEFFREVMHDETAAAHVYRALERYTSDQVAGLPAPGVGAISGDGVDTRSHTLRRLGVVQGTIVVAEGNAYQDAAEDYLQAQGARASAVNALVGFASYGALNDVAEVGGHSLGELAYPAGFDRLHDAEQIEKVGDRTITRANIVRLALAEHPERTPTVPVDQMSARERAELLLWARDVVGNDNEDLDELTAASSKAAYCLRPG